MDHTELPISDIVVTGGAGSIGSHIADAFASDHTVTVLDSLRTGSKEAVPDGAVFLQGDIRDEDTVTDVTSTADVIFHQAARVSVTDSVHHKAG
jgi:UDP-glucose 4-epimerase